MSKPWIEALKAFTDVTKLFEVFGLVECVLGCHIILMSHDLSKPISFNSLGLKLRDSETDAPYTEGTHSSKILMVSITEPTNKGNKIEDYSLFFNTI